MRKERANSPSSALCSYKCGWWCSTDTWPLVGSERSPTIEVFQKDVPNTSLAPRSCSYRCRWRSIDWIEGLRGGGVSENCSNLRTASRHRHRLPFPLLHGVLKRVVGTAKVQTQTMAAAAAGARQGDSPTVRRQHVSRAHISMHELRPTSKNTSATKEWNIVGRSDTYRTMP